ncbi:MAG: thiamine-phosphate kinase, partial [Pontixanthobacter sp.]
MSREFDFIDSLRAIATHPAARGLMDDTAVLQIGGEALILTHDAMVEGTHFLPEQDMTDVAWKLVATNLSDLAAKGAKPLGVLLGHSLGVGDDRFVAGLTEALARYDCPLLGGDTVSGEGTRTFGMTAIGTATHTPVPGRDGAQIGDALYITGSVGAAMLGFEALRDGTGAHDIAYRRPEPLIEEGRLLAPIVTSMMDVSDGLLLDASRIAIASGVELSIRTADIPIA